MGLQLIWRIPLLLWLESTTESLKTWIRHFSFCNPLAHWERAMASPVPAVITTSGICFCKHFTIILHGDTLTTHEEPTCHDKKPRAISKPKDTAKLCPKSRLWGSFFLGSFLDPFSVQAENSWSKMHGTRNVLDFRFFFLILEYLHTHNEAC